MLFHLIDFYYHTDKELDGVITSSKVALAFNELYGDLPVVPNQNSIAKGTDSSRKSQTSSKNQVEERQETESIKSLVIEKIKELEPISKRKFI